MLKPDRKILLRRKGVNRLTHLDSEIHYKEYTYAWYMNQLERKKRRYKIIAFIISLLIIPIITCVLSMFYGNSWVGSTCMSIASVPIGSFVVVMIYTLCRDDIKSDMNEIRYKRWRYCYIAHLKYEQDKKYKKWVL